MHCDSLWLVAEEGFSISQTYFGGICIKNEIGSIKYITCYFMCVCAHMDVCVHMYSV